MYQFKVTDINQNLVELNQYEGKVVLIINTATGCGLTPQYEQLQTLYERYKDQGFVILDFPSNQFLEQAPGSDKEINDFCTFTYHTTFPRFSKIDVNGENEHSLFTWLKKQVPEAKQDNDSISFEEKVKQFTPNQNKNDIKWNFEKFLINKKGDVISRFSPVYDFEALEAEIKSLL